MSMGLAHLFPTNEGTSTVLRRAGATQIPTFDIDWQCANAPPEPFDYRAEMTGVQKLFRADMASQRVNALDVHGRSTSDLPSFLPVASRTLLGNDSDVEITGTSDISGNTITFDIDWRPSNNRTDTAFLKKAREIAPPSCLTLLHNFYLTACVPPSRYP